jgi:transposase InsO family protein
MPWRECTRMSERRELVGLASVDEARVSQLSRSFGVSRKTVYKWLRRHAAEGGGGLADRSRRPHQSPGRTTAALESLVCQLRAQHPAWGGRKLHHRLIDLGLSGVPAPSTITGILRRNGLLSDARRLRRDWQRFEAPEPNDLWQMDFKGHFATDQGRCHPLTVLDDHSRFSICLAACTNERAETVRGHLSHAFELYGLPRRMLMDNGSPWGSEWAHPHTHLTAWLIRRGVSVYHGRAYHPQTQGKDERFHRTLKLEVISARPVWSDLVQVQQDFDLWRDVYNLERPHEAVANRPPASRYRPSPRRLPSELGPIEYDPGCEVRRVQDKGRISFRGRVYVISKAFIGEPVALRETGEGVWDVYYCHQRLISLDLTLPESREV